MSKAPKTESSAVRRGRTIGVAVFGATMTVFTAICSVEIIQQAWAAGGDAGSFECRDGVLRLAAAVGRARSLAAGTAGGEREALTAFRRGLEPEWASRGGVGRTCQGDPTASRALVELDRLRFAEEHAIRYEAVDIASLRRTVEALGRDLRDGDGASDR